MNGVFDMERQILLVLALLGLLVLPMSRPVLSQDTGSTSEERDLGWTTSATSNNTVEIYEDVSETSDIFGSFSGFISVYHSWNLSIECGVSLPVKLTVEYPKEFTPGEDVTISVAIESQPGYVFFNANGDMYLNVTLGFDLDSNIMGEAIKLGGNANLILYTSYATMFSTENIPSPIGEVSREISAQMSHESTMSLLLSLNIEMEQPQQYNYSHELSVEGGISIYAQFDVFIVAKTRVIGRVVAKGSAVSEIVNKTIEWTGEGAKTITVPTRSDASAGDTIDVSVDLEYVVEEFYVEFKNIMLVADIDDSKVGQMVGSVLGDLQSVMDWVIESLLEHFNGTSPMVITEIGETKPLEELGMKAEGSDNSLKSECPYGDASLMSESIKIGVRELWFLERPEFYIGIAAVAGGIAAVYLIVRRNRRK